MPCSSTLSLNVAATEQAMDAAIYDSTDNVIVGIRGNRLFLANPTTGALTGSLDVGTYARGNGCLAWDSASNRIFAAAWNSPQYALSGAVQDSTRNLYRLHVAAGTLVLDQVINIVTNFGQGVNSSASLAVGIMAMHPAGVAGNIYCLVSTQPANQMGGCAAIRFSAANPAVFTVSNGGSGPTYNNIVYGSIAGHDNAILPDPESGPQVDLFDFTANTASPFNVTSPKVMLAVGFAPTQQLVFVTDVAQKVYVYDPAGALQATVDTVHSAFNGLAVRYDSTDSRIYIPGGNDNTMLQINPATVVGNPVVGSAGGPVLIPGFDCPVDYVRAGAVRFAVQAGAAPLKAF